ncbi:MAG: nucleoside-diphosphate sugar epimerase/dehydratase [Pseudomonadota bacterium]
MNSVLIRFTDSFARRLRGLPRDVKRIILAATDFVMMPVAFWCAVVIKSESFSPEIIHTLWLYPLTAIIALPIFSYFGLHRMIVRFVSTSTLKAMAIAIVFSVTVFGLAANFLFNSNLSISLLLLYGIFAFIYLGGCRLMVRSLLRARFRSRERVGIYGAGEAGAQLAATLFSGESFLPMAFFDEKRSLQGSEVSGVTVYSPESLERVLSEQSITRLLLAVPSVSRRRRQEIINSLENIPVHVQIMPDLSDLVSGETRIDDFRDVEVNDLLDREAVPPNESLLRRCLADKVVMVTGAGGSIGSELSRQIVNHEPKAILLFENSELGLYNIEKEIRRLRHESGGDYEIFPLLGCVREKRRLTEIMTTFGVNTVYHAAAYKHVPVVEGNVISGVINNVFGTYQCAAAAISAGVEHFVLVSTDKAVNPTNVMGATKRLAELVLQALNERGSDTRFCMVRFGNVLASSGSVVLLFREQIRRGGPVTVTHPEIIRYFMTIPEAAQLVIQAGAMGQGGDVFLLDMGKPVKIDDLARRMVHLMGRTVLDDENPDGDIEIKYTGLRPAEKLFEELLIGDRVMGTEHAKIMRAQEKNLPWPVIETLLSRIESCAERSDIEGMLNVLSDAVEEYSRDHYIVDQVWNRRRSESPPVKVASVTTIKRRG